jgi:pimeloyl-ACP methyl ester carboxylesterase
MATASQFSATTRGKPVFSNYTVARAMSDMKEVVALMESNGTLAPGARFAVCGWSAGGMWALQLASEFPDRVAGVVVWASRCDAFSE